MEENNDGKAKGGHARAAVLSPEERAEIARKAAVARWNADLPKATHAGELPIAGVSLSCYVLENGDRVFSTRGVMASLGRRWRGRKYSGTELPVFLEAKNLKPFIDEHLLAVLKPIEFVTDRGLRAEGFKAEVLPATCEVYLRAREQPNVLTEAQRAVAQRCELLIRAFSRVGIIALVDEATGYQSVRDREALQALLDRYLRKELAAWAKTFPDEFYQQIFRLRGWQWKGMKVNRPSVVGKYTNDLVYERIAPGLLAELRDRNPPNASGQRKSKHHQWLTEDVGHPALAQHLHAVIGLMRASTTWDQFTSLLKRAFPKKGATLELQLDDAGDFSIS